MSRVQRFVDCPGRFRSPRFPAVGNALSAGPMRLEVATPELAADLASLLRRCGYEDAEVRGRFVTVARLNPGPPPLEDIRLAAFVDVWRRRHGGAAASRRR